MNVKITFLNRSLHEDVYMTQPEGFESKKQAIKIHLWT